MNGKLTISRVHGNDCDPYVKVETIIVSDGERKIIRAKLSIQDFGEALLGLVHVPCTVRTRIVHPTPPTVEDGK